MFQAFHSQAEEVKVSCAQEHVHVTLIIFGKNTKMVLLNKGAAILYSMNTTKQELQECFVFYTVTYVLTLHYKFRL